jgi:hypothetical protein
MFVVWILSVKATDAGKVHLSELQELFAKPTEVDVARRRRVGKRPCQSSRALPTVILLRPRGGSLPNVSLGTADAGANVKLGYGEVCIV